MTGAVLRMLAAAGVALAVLLAAWTAFRLWQARGALLRLRDERQAEDALRAQAEAILAARLARGEIDRDDYERFMGRLWEPVGGQGLPKTSG